MTDQIKSFLSRSFSVVAIVAIMAGLYQLSDYGWDVSKYYFFTGGGLALISQFIEFTRAEDDY